MRGSTPPASVTPPRATKAMATSPASRADDAPIKPHPLGRLALGVGERGGGDGGGIVELRAATPLAQEPGAIDARQPLPARHALGGDAAVRAFEMRPDRPFLVRRRAEAHVAELGGDGRMPAGGLDQRGDAEPGAGPENQPRALGLESRAGRCARVHSSGIDRQRERLRLEIVEQQAAAEAKLSRDLAARRCSQGALESFSLPSTIGPAPQAITDFGRAASFGSIASIASARPG